MDLHRRQVFLKTMPESDIDPPAETDRSDTGLWSQFLFIVMCQPIALPSLYQFPGLDQRSGQIDGESAAGVSPPEQVHGHGSSSVPEYP